MSETILKVNTLTDENDGSATEGTGLSLRDAILIANSTPEDEIIELESNTIYELSIAGEDSNSRTAAVGDLDIDSTGGTLTIRGLGEGATIDGNEIDRVLHVRDDDDDNGGTLILEDITVTGGKSVDGGLLGDSSDGGAILIDNFARAELTNSTITGNSTSLNNDRGGGIANEGGLILNNSSVSNNVAVEGGGVYTNFGVTYINNSTISGNVADGGDRTNVGGAVSHRGTGTTEISNSNIIDNTASNFGGGVYINNGLLSSDRTGSLRIVDSTIDGNNARIGGGVFSGSVESAVIENTVIENNNAGFGGGVRNEGGTESDNMVIADSTIRNNQASGDGGGISANDDLTIRNSTISGNIANENGGGVETNLTTVRIFDSTVDGNTAGGQGGGLYDVQIIRGSTISNNTAGRSGGGVFGNIGVIVDSTISGNQTDRLGGGIFSAGSGFELATIAIANSTVSGNSARGNGGGIGIELEASVVANNVTITNNLADSNNNGEGDGGGIYNPGATVAELDLNNSILIGNFDTPENNGEGTINPNISGPAKGDARNLVGDLTGLTVDALTEGESLGTGSDLTDVEPLLGELEDNGGATQTHALLAGSPAIDAGSNENIFRETFVDINGDGEPSTIDFNGDGDVDDPLEFDQRGEGFDRIFGDTVDIGAYEVQENLPESEPEPEPEPTPLAPNLDIDNNGEADALTDGILVIRHLFGASGDSLLDGAIASDATRTTASEIANVIDEIFATTE